MSDRPNAILVGSRAGSLAPEFRRRPASIFQGAPLIVFDNAIVDFEARTIAIRRVRYLLDGRAFALLVALLSAEGNPVPKRALMLELALPAGRSGTDSLSRLIRKIRGHMRAKGQEHLLETGRHSHRLLT